MAAHRGEHACMDGCHTQERSSCSAPVEVRILTLHTGSSPMDAQETYSQTAYLLRQKAPPFRAGGE